ncbi:MAG: hypothetical protein LBV43_14440 [Prevotella sp.]|nr:hypothetical protein [Prevotella sp.]
MPKAAKGSKRALASSFPVDPLTTCRLKVINGFAHHFLRQLHCMGTPTFKQTDAGLKHQWRKATKVYTLLLCVSLPCISSASGNLSGKGGVDANGRSRLFASANKPLTGRRGTKH